MRYNSIKAILFFFLAIAFADAETNYFLRRDGYHYYPETFEETLCDAIAMLMYFFAAYFAIKEFSEVFIKKDE